MRCKGSKVFYNEEVGKGEMFEFVFIEMKNSPFDGVYPE